MSQQIVIGNGMVPSVRGSCNSYRVRVPRDELMAYRFPGKAGTPSSGVRPMNITRVMASQYLGASLQPLPDLSDISGWKHPYLLVETRPGYPASHWQQ